MKRRSDFGSRIPADIEFMALAILALIIVLGRLWGEVGRVRLETVKP